MKTLYEKESARLKELFKEKSPYSQREFAKRYNLGTPGNLWQYLSGRRPLNVKIASCMSQALGIAIEEFSPRLAKEIAAIQGGANVTMLEPEELERKRKKVPLISFAHAGALTNTGDLIPDEYIDAFGDYPDGCFALRVSGDSMTPVFDDGDIVIIDPNRAPKFGNYVVARSDGSGMDEATLKQYFELDYDEECRTIFELRPLNPAYPSMHSTKHKLQIVGVVCGLKKEW